MKLPAFLFGFINRFQSGNTYTAKR